MAESLCLVVDNTKDGKCSNCGQCCSDMLPLSEKEVRTIKKYVSRNHIKEQRHNVATGVDLTCPFRDERQRKCLIYDVRPEICREFMCNQSIDEIRSRRDGFHDVNRVVFMRTEFYGNTEDSDWYNETVTKMLLNEVATNGELMFR